MQQNVSNENMILNFYVPIILAGLGVIVFWSYSPKGAKVLLGLFMISILTVHSKELDTMLGKGR